MYFVDQQKIYETLDYMDALLKELEEERSYHTFEEKRALERMSHVLIESVLDVGSMMIDGFIMRDPGGLNDIIDILVDENVLPEHEVSSYKAIIPLRKMVIKDYLSVDHSFILDTLREHHDTLKKFSAHIKAYLMHESGNPNAFLNPE